MLDKQAIEKAPLRGRGFLSTLFLVPPEASNKPKVLEHVCAHTALQDGGHPCLERVSKSRRLDGKSGSEGYILYAPNPRG